ncbi:sodium-dependent transporter [Congregibacter brevis]|uniref:Sodium-dependent transporter n=1 Tax=Congregibacter brevis TaxID=3081201 RepID=A0ABZ0IBU4_9GAMM|nr:sodium-dependent transporter [Congregibacter sp. IMCC45268]
MNLYSPVERWQSRTTFVFALAIAAVGLGNLWRFAWLMGEHGGAPFFFSYLFCLFFIGVPLLVAEVVLGSHGRGSPFLTMSWATDVSNRSRLWLTVALLSCLAGFLLLVSYLLIAGWSLAYAYQMQLGGFAAIALSDAAEAFDTKISAPAGLLRWQFLAAVILALTVALGLRRGIGLFVWIAVPLLITLLGVIVSFSIEFGDLSAAGEFLFAWQPMDFDRGSFMAALGHAFYTLCIGVAVGMSYGAYAPSKLPIVRAVVTVALFDVVVAVAAGVAIFPVLFANNLVPAQGFGLLFISVPYAFGNMPFGDLYGALFFVTVFVTVLGTAVALLEPIVSVLEQQFRVPRVQAAIGMAVIAFMLSAYATVDLGAAEKGQGFLQWLDGVTAEWLIPAAVLLLALFVGWRMPRDVLRQELAREPDILFSLWYFLIRFVAVPVIAFAWLWLSLVP